MKKAISFFLSLLMFFILLPVSALASGNTADVTSAEETGPAVEGSQSETGTLYFLGADNVDETHAYHYRVEAAVLENVTLTPQPDYTETSALSYQWLRFDAAQDTYVELPEKIDADLTFTVFEDEIGVEDLYACIVTAPDAAGVAMFTLAQRAPIDKLEVPADEPEAEEQIANENTPVLLAVSDVPVNGSNTTAQYSSDWEYWCQGASKYDAMRQAGCRVVAYSKLIREAGYALSSPDTLFEWGKGTYFRADTFEIGSIGNAPKEFIKQQGGALNMVTSVPLTGNNSQDAQTAYNLIKQGYYVVLIGGTHTTYIGKSASLSAGKAMILDSWNNWSSHQNTKQAYSTYYSSVTFNTAYCFTASSATKPAKTKDMSVNDYMTYYAQSVTAFSGTAKPKNGTLKLYRLPETLNNTVSYTTTTGSVKLTRKVVNSAGNTWYEISTGAFVWSGDITILAAPTITNVVPSIETANGKGNKPRISFHVGWSSSNKPKSWKLEYGTTSSYGSKHEESFTDAVLNQYNPVPCSVQFGSEEPALWYNTVYYYRITVKATSGDEVTETGKFTTGRCSIHNWNSGSITTQPTCCATGVKTYTCTNPGCSDTKTEVVAATGQHSWNSGSITTPPTCTATGVKTYTCTNYGCSATRTETVAATGQHTWDNGTVTEAAAPGKAGTKTYTCTVCKRTKTESIPALPVTYTVSYDANGGTGAPDAQTKTHDVALTLSTTVPTRDSYTFLGWAANETATAAQYQPGGSYTDNTSVLLYAVWEKNGASVEEQLRAAIANGENEFYLVDDLTLSADLTIPQHFFLLVHYATFTIPNGVTLTIDDYGSFYASHTVIQSGGKVVSNGVFGSYLGGSITVEKGGTLENNGIAGVDAGGSLHNYGAYAQTENAELYFLINKANPKIDLIGIDRKYVQLLAYATTESEIRALFSQADGIYKASAHIIGTTDITLSADLTIPQNVIIRISENSVLTVPQNVSLVNNSEILLLENGRLVIESGAVLVNNEESRTRTGGSSHITIAGVIDMHDTAYAYIDADTWTCTGTILRNGDAIILYKDVTTATELETALQSGAELVNVIADITLDRSVTIPKNVLLDIYESVKLTIPAPYTLTNYGDIEVFGTLDIGGTFTGEEIIVSGGTLIPDSIPHRTMDVFVNNITINGNDTVTVGCTTTFTVNVLPDDAFNPYVNWTIVSGENLASIYSSGYFIAGNTPGTVTIRAAAVDGSGIYAEKTITILAAEPKDPDAPQVVVSSEKAFPGEIVKVTIFIENNPGIVAAYFSVSYSDKLTLVSATDSGLLNDHMFDNKLTSNPYNLSWSDASARENNMGNGVIATLEFLVAEDCEPGDLPVRIICRTDDTCNMDLDNVSFTAVDGVITVTDYILGDVDGDGKVTTKDSILIRRYLLGGWNVTLNENAADIDKDGKITTKDSILIRRYLLGGWDIELK